MIEAHRPAGTQKELARCICDRCGVSVDVPAKHGNTNGGIGAARARMMAKLGSPGQAIKKLGSMDWEYVKGQLFCPKCKVERRMKVAEVATVTAIREPSREQKREIMEMLKVAYDVPAGRYVGGNTDQTIAAELGGGIMPGWVAEIRDEWFGPGGGNDEIEAVVADLTKWQADMDASAKAMHELLTRATADLRAFNEGRGKAAEFLARIEAIKKAVGPKARSA